MKQKTNRKLRVDIAKDVIAQLRLQRYEASHCYVNVEGYGDLSDEEFESSFKTIFKKKKNVTCRVCALGSAFVSLVNIKNECDVSDMVEGNTNMFERLEEVFGQENMSLMESAFECGVTDYKDDDYDEEWNVTLQAATAWGDKYSNDNERLRRIMQNVIRNNGDFKLPKRMLEKYKAERKARLAQYAA